MCMKIEVNDEFGEKRHKKAKMKEVKAKDINVKAKDDGGGDLTIPPFKDLKSKLPSNPFFTLGKDLVPKSITRGKYTTWRPKTKDASTYMEHVP